MAPVGGQRSAFEDGAAGPDQAGDRRDALSQGGRAVHPPRAITVNPGSQSEPRFQSPFFGTIRPQTVDL